MTKDEVAEQAGREAGRKDEGLSRYRVQFKGNEWHAFVRGYFAGKKEAKLAKQYSKRW